MKIQLNWVFHPLLHYVMMRYQSWSSEDKDCLAFFWAVEGECLYQEPVQLEHPLQGPLSPAGSKIPNGIISKWSFTKTIKSTYWSSSTFVPNAEFPKYFFENKNRCNRHFSVFKQEILEKKRSRNIFQSSWGKISRGCNQDAFGFGELETGCLSNKKMYINITDS